VNAKKSVKKKALIILVILVLSFIFTTVGVFFPRAVTSPSRKYSHCTGIPIVWVYQHVTNETSNTYPYMYTLQSPLENPTYFIW